MILIWLVPWFLIQHIRILRCFPTSLSSSQWPPRSPYHHQTQNVPSIASVERRSGPHISTWTSSKSDWRSDRSPGSTSWSPDRSTGSTSWSPERGTKSLVYLGAGGQGDIEVTPSSNTQVAEEQEVLNVSDKNSPYALINKYFPERESYYHQNKDNFEHGWRRGYTPDIGNLKPDEVWMVDDNMLVLKGGSTKSEKAGFEDIWEPLDDYEAPYREPLLPPNNEAPYAEPLLTTNNLGNDFAIKSEENKVKVNTVGNFYSFENKINPEPIQNSIEQPLKPFKDEISRSTAEEYLPFLNHVIQQMQDFQPQKRRALPLQVISATPATINPPDPPAAFPSDSPLISASLNGINQEKYKQSYGTFFDNNHFILNPRSEHLAPEGYYPTEKNIFSNFDEPSLGRTLPPYKFIAPLQSGGREELNKHPAAGNVAAAWWEAPALAALTAQTKPAEASIHKESPSPRAIFGGNEFGGEVSAGHGGKVKVPRVKVEGSGSGVLAAQLLYKQIQNQKSSRNSNQPENSQNSSIPNHQQFQQDAGKISTNNRQRQVFTGFVPVLPPTETSANDDKWKFNVFAAVPGSKENSLGNEQVEGRVYSLPQQHQFHQGVNIGQHRPQEVNIGQHRPQEVNIGQNRPSVTINGQTIQADRLRKSTENGELPYNPPVYNTQQQNIYRTSSKPTSGGGARTYRTVQNSSNPSPPSRDSRYISFYSGMRSGGSSWGYTYNMK